MDRSTIQAMARTFRALADPTRVRILAILAEGEQHVGALAACLEMSPSAISHQLNLLSRMRLVRRRQQGKRVFYALDDEHVRDLFQVAQEHVTEKRDEFAG